MTTSRPDPIAVSELGRLSPAKLAEIWSARPTQKQILSNVLHGRVVTKAQRQQIAERMQGRPLRELAVVVAEVLLACRRGDCRESMKTGATLSPCRRYRYALWREWDPSMPTVVFCGLNPSTADETTDDATVRKELAYARSWGFGKYVKVNAYGYRSTDPAGLWTADDPRGPDNFLFVRHHARGGTFVAAWGNNIRVRDEWELRRMLRLEGIQVHALKLTKQGNPQHPLYLPGTLQPFVWLSAGMVDEPRTDTRITTTAEASSGAAHEAVHPPGHSAHPPEVAARGRRNHNDRRS